MITAKLLHYFPGQFDGVDPETWAGIQWIGEPPITEGDFEALPWPVVTPDAVDAERDRRIDGTMTFGGVVYQTRPQDRENVAGASIMALAAMMNGAQPGNLRWHGGDSDFVWIAEDNSMIPMDAQTLFAFGQAMAAHKHAHIFAARAIKDSESIPLDYTDDAYWPSAPIPTMTARSSSAASSTA